MSANRRSLRTAALSVAVAGAILAVLLFVVGPRAVADALASADRGTLVVVVLAAIGWMTAWSRSLHLVVRLLGVPVTRRRSFLVYSSVLFVNNLAPFSVVGAQPVAALLVSRYTGEPYERSFAAAASVDLLNYLPAPVFAVVGLAYFAVTASLGRTVEVVAVSVVGFLLLALLVGTLAWRNRRRLARAIPGLVARLDRRIGTYLPASLRVGDSLALERRTDAAVDALELIAGDRPTLVAGVASSALGWSLFSSVLWLALFAVGATVPVAVPLFVLPVATVTNLLPLPGGVGSVDATLVVLLVLTTGLPATTATAAVVVHRSATVLLPVLVGGASIVVLRRG